MNMNMNININIKCNQKLYSSLLHVSLTAKEETHSLTKYLTRKNGSRLLFPTYSKPFEVEDAGKAVGKKGFLVGKRLLAAVRQFIVISE